MLYVDLSPCDKTSQYVTIGLINKLNQRSKKWFNTSSKMNMSKHALKTVWSAYSNLFFF